MVSEVLLKSHIQSFMQAKFSVATREGLRLYKQVLDIEETNVNTRRSKVADVTMDKTDVDLVETDVSTDWRLEGGRRCGVTIKSIAMFAVNVKVIPSIHLPCLHRIQSCLLELSRICHL